MVESLDVAKLQGELHDLQRQRSELDARLRQGPGGRGQRFPGAGPRDRPPHRPPQDVRPPPGQEPWHEPELAPPRRPLVSSVVAPAEDSGRGERKRPAEGALLEESTDVKRRNKRLFGAILGTLQRFSRDEQEARSTAAAQRRAEIERKAEERQAAETARLRQQAADERREMREGDVARKREISAAAACKRLEIAAATRLARADKLAARFLLTAAEPRLYWAPAAPCAEADALAEGQRQAHLAWKEAQLQALEAEKTALAEAMARPRRRGPPPPGGEPGASAGAGGDEEMEAADARVGEGEGRREASEGAQEEAAGAEDAGEEEAAGEEEDAEMGEAADAEVAEQAAGGEAGDEDDEELPLRGPADRLPPPPPPPAAAGEAGEAGAA